LKLCHTNLKARSQSVSGQELRPSRPGEFHPEPLTEPDLNLSADFLRQGLRREGIETGEPIAEDWGGVVPLIDDPFGVWVGCSNNEDYADGFWCFLHPHKVSLRRLFSASAELRAWASLLREAIDKVLNED
jgi:hypothetical protein